MALMDELLAREQERLNARIQSDIDAEGTIAPQRPSLGRGALSALGTGGAFIGRSVSALGEAAIRELGGPETYPALRAPLQATQSAQQYFQRRGEELATDAPELDYKNIDWTNPSSIGRAVTFNIAAQAPIISGALLGGGTALSSLTTGGVYAEQPEEQKNIGRAIAAGIASGSLDYASLKALKIPGLNSLLKTTANLPAQEAKEVITKHILKEIGKGVGKGIAAEVPTEVTQQMIERAGAFKSLTDEEARDEYLQAGVGALLVGGPLGAFGGFVDAVSTNRQKLIDDEVTRRLQDKTEPIDLGTNSPIEIEPLTEPVTTIPEQPRPVVGSTMTTALGDIPVIDAGESAIQTVPSAQIRQTLKVTQLPEQVQTIFSTLPLQAKKTIFGYDPKTKSIRVENLIREFGGLDLEGYGRRLAELDVNRDIRRQREQLPSGTQMAFPGFEDTIGYRQSELAPSIIPTQETIPQGQLTFEQAPRFTPELGLTGGVNIPTNLEYGSPFQAPQEGLVGPIRPKRKKVKQQQQTKQPEIVERTIQDVIQDKTKEKPINTFIQSIESASTITDITAASNAVQKALKDFNKAVGLNIPFEQNTLAEVYKTLKISRATATTVQSSEPVKKATKQTKKKEVIKSTPVSKATIERYGKSWGVYIGEGESRRLVGVYPTKKAAQEGARPRELDENTKKFIAQKEAEEKARAEAKRKEEEAAKKKKIEEAAKRKDVIIRKKIKELTVENAITSDRRSDIASALNDYVNSVKEVGTNIALLKVKSDQLLERLRAVGFTIDSKGPVSLQKARQLSDAINAAIIKPQKEVAVKPTRIKSKVSLGDIVNYNGKEYEVIEISLVDDTVILENIETGKELKNPINIAKLDIKKSTTVTSDTFASAKVMQDRLMSTRTGKAIKHLIQNKTVNFVDTYNKLPDNVKSIVKDNTFSGLYFDGKVYLVADKISPANLQGIVLHEVAVHYGLRKVIGDKNYNSIMIQLENLKELKNKAVIEAYNNVPIETQVQDINEEALGYLIEKHTKQPIVQKIISYIKAWLFRMGILNANKLDDSDIIQIAKAGLKVKTSHRENNFTNSPMYTYAGVRGIKEGGFTPNELPGNMFKNLADGKFRYEIDDSKMKLLKDHQEIKEEFNSNKPFTLDDIIYHEELFKLYPWTKNIKVISKELPSKVNAGYLESTGQIVLNQTKAFSPNELKQTLLHEIQHSIQSYEDFGVGTSPTAEQRLLDSGELINIEIKIAELKVTRNELRDKQTSSTDINEIEELQKEIDKINNKIINLVNKTNAQTRYKNSAGEIEARDVAARAFLSLAERKKVKPYTTEEIPLKEWIVKHRNNKYQYMGSYENLMEASNAFRKTKVLDNISNSPIMGEVLNSAVWGEVKDLVKASVKATLGLPYWTRGMEEITKETIKLQEYFNSNITNITKGKVLTKDGKSITIKGLTELTPEYNKLKTINNFKEDFDDLLVFGDIKEVKFVTKEQAENLIGRKISKEAFNFYKDYRLFLDNTRHNINELLEDIYPKIKEDKTKRDQLVKYLTGHIFRVRRYGKYAVRGYIERPSKKDPETMVREQIYTRFFNTDAEAKRFAAELQSNPKNYFKWYFHKEDVDGNFVTRVEKEVKFQESRNAFELMSTENIISEALSKLDRREAGILDGLNQEALKNKIMERVFEEALSLRGLGRNLRRSEKLIEGYEQENIFDNMSYALQNVARSLAKAKYAFNQYGIIKDLKREYQQDAYDFVKESLKPRTYFDQTVSIFRNINTVMLLGFRLLQPLINVTQTFSMGFPELIRVVRGINEAQGIHESYTKTAERATKILFKSMRDILSDLYKSGLPKSGKESIIWIYDYLTKAGLYSKTMLEEGSGNISDIERQVLNTFSRKAIELQSIANYQNGIDEAVYFKDKKTKIIANITEISTIPLFASELLNKEAAILAAYRLLARNKTEFDKFAYDVAEQYVLDSHGVANRYNLPKLGRTPVGRLFYSLLSFPLHYFNYLYTRLVKGATSKNYNDVLAGMFSLALMGALGGLKAMPFEDALDWLLSKIFGIDYKHNIRKIAGDVLGSPNLGWAITNGISAAFPKVGIDISNNVALRTPFLSGMFEGRDSLESISGASGAIISKLRQSINYADEANYVGMFMALTPEVLNNAYRQYKTFSEGYKTGTGDKLYIKGEPQTLDFGDALLSGFIGMRTTDVTRVSEARRTTRTLDMAWKDAKKRAIEKFKRTGEFKHITRFNSKLADSSASNLVTPITQQSIRNALDDKPDKMKTQFEQQELSDML